MARPWPRLIHRQGAVFEAIFSPAEGIPWEGPASVRFSAFMQTPRPLPEVLGLAVRLTSGQKPLDLTFFSARTPKSRTTRYPSVLPSNRRCAANTMFSSVMGYREGDRIVKYDAYADPTVEYPRLGSAFAELEEAAGYDRFAIHIRRYPGDGTVTSAGVLTMFEPSTTDVRHWPGLLPPDSEPTRLGEFRRWLYGVLQGREPTQTG